MENEKPSLSTFATVQEYKDAAAAFDAADRKRRAEDAERLSAEKLEWVEPKSLGDLLMPKAQRDAILARHAAPAVDAAELGKLATYDPDRENAGLMELRDTYNDGDYAKVEDVRALVAQQAARIEELEQQAPGFEAIGWAYTKLLAFGCGANNIDSAMMLDRLNLMLLEGK